MCYLVDMVNRVYCSAPSACLESRPKLKDASIRIAVRPGTFVRVLAICLRFRHSPATTREHLRIGRTETMTGTRYLFFSHSGYIVLVL